MRSKVVSFVFVLLSLQVSTHFAFQTNQNPTKTINLSSTKKNRKIGKPCKGLYSSDLSGEHFRYSPKAPPPPYKWKKKPKYKHFKNKKEREAYAKEEELKRVYYKYFRNIPKNVPLVAKAKKKKYKRRNRENNNNNNKNDNKMNKVIDVSFVKAQNDKVKDEKKLPRQAKAKLEFTDAEIENKEAMVTFQEFIEKTTQKYQGDELFDIDLLRELRKPWFNKFSKLYTYKMMYGDASVPINFPDNPELSQFVSSERLWHKMNRQLLLPTRERKSECKSSFPLYFINPMHQTRYVLLNEIGFNFVIHDEYTISKKLLKKYILMCEYVDKFGNADVPRDYHDLGYWVIKQREWYKKKKKKLEKKLNSASHDLFMKGSTYREWIMLMDNLGFNWNPQNPNKQPKNLPIWYDRLQELKDYKERFGHTNVPRLWRENIPLGKWVNTQRWWYRQFTDEDGMLYKYNYAHQERIRLLNEIGFEWRTPKEMDVDAKPSDSKWLQWFNQLKVYVEKNGICNMPAEYRPNPLLGEWVEEQRKWHKMMVERNNTAQPPIEVITNNETGNIITSTTTNNNNSDSVCLVNTTDSRMGVSDLPPEIAQSRMELLDSVGLNWTPQRDPTWDEQYEKLVKFYKEFGHSNVMATWDRDPSLGKWVQQHRYWYNTTNNENISVSGLSMYLKPNKDSLLQQRMSLLNKIDFPWIKPPHTWKKIHRSWMVQYKRLSEFKDRFGHTNVPQRWSKNIKLAKWVQYERTYYQKLQKQGELEDNPVTVQKIKLMNKIGFQWHIVGKSYWWQMYNKLVMYYEENNQSFEGLASSDYVLEDAEFYQFLVKLRRHVQQYYEKVQRLRTAHNVSTRQLTKERLDALRRIGICWLPDPVEAGTFQRLVPPNNDPFGWTEEQRNEFDNIEFHHMYPIDSAYNLDFGFKKW